MSWSVRWIVLPDGVVGDELKLSIVATPAGSPPLDWPALLADLQPRRLVSADGALDLPLTITSSVESVEWPRCGATSGALTADIAEAARELDELERSLASFSPTAWPNVGDAAALGALGEMVATRRRGRIPVSAIARLVRRAPAAREGDAAVRLRLRIDATVPRFDGEHPVRVVAGDGRLLDGPVQVPSRGR